MKKILVPTDFSEFADNALKMAVEIARKTNAEISLLHIMLTSNNTIVRVSETESFISQSPDQQYLQSIVEVSKVSLNDMIKKTGYAAISYQILSGNVTNKVVDVAQNQGFDLIIMGTQGNSKYEGLFIGSNAEKIVRLAACPVITLRKVPANFDFSDMVLACNLDEKDTLPIERVKEFHTLFGGKLHLVHINTPANFTTTKDLQAKARNFIRKHELQNTDFQVYCDYIEDDGIVNFAKSVEADLIALISHQRTGLSRLLVGSVSEGVVSESFIPVLTFSLKN